MKLNIWLKRGLIVIGVVLVIYIFIRIYNLIKQAKFITGGFTPTGITVTKTLELQIKGDTFINNPTNENFHIKKAKLQIYISDVQVADLTLSEMDIPPNGRTTIKDLIGSASIVSLALRLQDWLISGVPVSVRGFAEVRIMPLVSTTVPIEENFIFKDIKQIL